MFSLDFIWAIDLISGVIIFQNLTKPTDPENLRILLSTKNRWYSDEYALSHYPIHWVFILSISHKKSSIFSRIGVVAQSKQRNIQHRMLPRDYTAPYVPYAPVCSLVWHYKLPCSALYASLLGTILSFVRHHIIIFYALKKKQNKFPRGSPI